ncbi:MAG: YecH family metal-binding protein [Saezia sp.]
MSIHGHKILEMMAGNSYTENQLLQSIHAKFGENTLFHTCSAKDLNAEQIIVFLKQKGKFRPTQEGQFTLDESSVCDHE